MKIGAIIQARMSSTRLPGKVLKELPYGSNITVISQVIRRLKRCKQLDDIVVATTSKEEDNQIVEIALSEEVKYFRGSSENVLERYYFTAKEHEIDTVVRITSDCPCIDPEIVDLTVEKHLASRADYTSNCLPRTFPHGLDVEVIEVKALHKAYIGASTDLEKEHVTTYFYKTAPNLFRIVNYRAPAELYAPHIRITLDTEKDYALLCAVYDYLYPENPYFSGYHIKQLFDQKPWLKLINNS